MFWINTEERCTRLPGNNEYMTGTGVFGSGPSKLQLNVTTALWETGQNGRGIKKHLISQE